MNFPKIDSSNFCAVLTAFPASLSPGMGLAAGWVRRLEPRGPVESVSDRLRCLLNERRHKRLGVV